MAEALLLSLAVSLGLTLVLELAFALVCGVRGRGLLLVALMNLLTNPAAVTIHFFCTAYLGWTSFWPVLLLEAAVVAVEALCCRGVIRRPWRFALAVNAFSYTIGLLLQRL